MVLHSVSFFRNVTRRMPQAARVVLFADENEVRKVFQHSFASVASGEAYDFIHRCDTNVRGAASVVLPLLR